MTNTKTDTITAYAVVTTGRFSDVEAMFHTRKEAYAEIKMLSDVYGFPRARHRVVKGTWTESTETWKADR